MSLSLSVALYFVIWFITLFAVLPFGVETQEEAGEVVPGTPESAPASPRIWRVVIVNTIVASIVFAIVWATLTFKWIDLTKMSVPGMR